MAAEVTLESSSPPHEHRSISSGDTTSRASGPQHVKSTTIYYCTRHPLYKTIKPYLIDFETSSSFPKTNIIPEPHEVSIADIRGSESLFSFEESGFAVLEMQTQMKYEDFEDHSKIRSVYCAEIAACLLEYLGADEVQVFDFAVRRRHPSYPFQVTSKLPSLQPATQVHLDSSFENLDFLIRNLNGDRAEQILKGYHCSYSNVWKPLCGPVKDWPLALCDASTVKSRDEFIPSDVLGDCNRLSEDLRMFHESDHRWYYLSAQMPDELLLFRQADTNFAKMGVPHTSFSNLEAGEPAYERESIEVRALIFHAKDRSDCGGK